MPDAELTRTHRDPELPRAGVDVHPEGDERTIYRSRREPRAINEDPAYRELERADRALVKLSKYMSSELGPGCDTVGFIADARGALYDAQQSYAAETRPRATTFLRGAVARAAARRAR